MAALAGKRRDGMTAWTGRYEDLLAGLLAGLGEDLERVHLLVVLHGLLTLFAQ